MLNSTVELVGPRSCETTVWFTAVEAERPDLFWHLLRWAGGMAQYGQRHQALVHSAGASCHFATKTSMTCSAGPRGTQSFHSLGLQGSPGEAFDRLLLLGGDSVAPSVLLGNRLSPSMELPKKFLVV